jgi:hypothetical protein
MKYIALTVLGLSLAGCSAPIGNSGATQALQATIPIVHPHGRVSPSTCTEPLIVVATNTGVESFACGALIRTLAGAKTGYTTGAIAVDKGNSLLYISNQSGYISVFDLDASGNVSAKYKLNSYSIYSRAISMVVDSAGYLWVGQGFNGSGTPGSILRFAPGSKGMASPVQSIGGTATEILSGPSFGDIAVDASNNVYISNETASGPSNILEFASTANGNVAPIKVIQGPKTGIGSLDAIAVDGTGRILDTNYMGNVVRVFGASASGNVAPIQTLSGPSTGLGAPNGLGVGSSNNIYAGNTSLNTVTKYPSTANGNFPPSSTLSVSDGVITMVICGGCS